MTDSSHDSHTYLYAMPFMVQTYRQARTQALVKSRRIHEKWDLGSAVAGPLASDHYGSADSRDECGQPGRRHFGQADDSSRFVATTIAGMFIAAGGPHGSTFPFAGAGRDTAMLARRVGRARILGTIAAAARPASDQVEVLERTQAHRRGSLHSLRSPQPFAPLDGRQRWEPRHPAPVSPVLR
jgi:hypothetical protein